MKIAVLGTGEVGRRIASRLVETGHEVVLGSRTADNEAAVAWAAENGAANGTFADAAAFGELIVNATGGNVSIVVLQSAGVENLDGKVLMDVSNPLDFSGGFPPKVTTYDGHSLAEEIQKQFPGLRVVKTLNTMNNGLMVDPRQLSAEHVVFLSGEDAEAKTEVANLLRGFGWRDSEITDLGGLASALATEQYCLLWVHMVGAVGHHTINIAIVRD